jgi:hypothetical protein
VLSSDEPQPDAADLQSSNPVRRHSAALEAADQSALRANFARHGGWLVTVRGSDHVTFSDAAWAAVQRPWSSSSEASRRAWGVIRDTVLGFLDAQLAGRPSALPAAGASPGSVIESWPRVAGAGASGPRGPAAIEACHGAG